MLVVWVEARTTFLTTDGMLFVILSSSGETIYDSIYIDLNGSKEPNRLGKDLFYFVRTDKGVLPQCYNGTISTVNSDCSKTENGRCCAAKIAHDGWEIKDDYPW